MAGLPNQIARYRIASDGGLTHLGNTPSDAVPWGVHVSPSGRYLLVSAFEGGTLSAYEIGSEGELANPVAIKHGKMVRDTAFVVFE